MTDKLKELVAKWRQEFRVDGDSTFMVCASALEAILAEQAPAGEFDAWWGKYIADVDACQGKRNIARDAYAAGRSSQPSKPQQAAGSRRSLDVD